MFSFDTALAACSESIPDSNPSAPSPDNFAASDSPSAYSDLGGSFFTESSFDPAPPVISPDIPLDPASDPSELIGQALTDVIIEKAKQETVS